MLSKQRNELLSITSKTRHSRKTDCCAFPSSVRALFLLFYTLFKCNWHIKDHCEFHLLTAPLTQHFTRCLRRIPAQLCARFHSAGFVRHWIATSPRLLIRFSSVLSEVASHLSVHKLGLHCLLSCMGSVLEWVKYACGRIVCLYLKYWQRWPNAVCEWSMLVDVQCARGRTLQCWAGLSVQVQQF